MEEKAVKLHNGAEEFEPLVHVTMSILSDMIKEKPIHFYELVMKARNPAHRCSGTTGQDLQQLNLLERDGDMHSSIRNIVLSASAGDGLALRLRWPECPTPFCTCP